MCKQGTLRSVFFPHRYMHISSWNTKIRRTSSRTHARAHVRWGVLSLSRVISHLLSVLEQVLRIFVCHELMCIYLWGKKTHLE